MTITEFLPYLKGSVKKQNNGYIAQCPAHDDKHASLSISVGNKGQILLHCHAGCTTDQIVQALGLRMHDLFQEAPEFPKSSSRKLVTSYKYRDTSGKLLCEKLRYSDKSFLWRQMGTNGWVYNRKGLTEIPLYCLNQLKGDTVYLVEGEKDVETMLSGGLPAVCSPDGAGKGKWKPYMSEQLKGIHVRVIQDNDEIGKVFAQEECNALLGIAASVKLIDLSILWNEMPEKADVTDYVNWSRSNGLKPEQIFKHIAKYAETLPLYQLPALPQIKKQSSFDFDQFPVKCTADIDFKQTPKIQFYIEDLISEGVSFLTAFSKVGKSRMLMQMLLSICNGSSFLKKSTMRADVLYCAFEDERIDFENRLKKFLNGAPQPKNFYYYTKEMFNYTTPTLGQDSILIPLLEHILQQHPSIKVIAIDVFSIIRSKRKAGLDFTMHERSDIDELLKLTAKYRVAVIVAHHVSKTGLNANRQNATGSGAGSYMVSGGVHAELEIALDPDDNKRAKFTFKGRRIAAGSLAIQDEFPYWILEGNWDDIKFTENPVVIMVRWLVEQYGSWKGSTKEFCDANLKSGQPLLIKKPNRRTFADIADQLLRVGIQYIEHSNGTGGSKYEFRRLDDADGFVEIDSIKSWEELTLEV